MLLENVVQLLNLALWRQQNEISRKLVDPGQRNLSWKKGGLAGSKARVH